MTEHGITRVGVIGAGQMGGGIAQIAATSGFQAILYDEHGGAVDRCKATHDKLLSRAVEKGRISAEDAEATKARITFAEDLNELGDTQIVIEAVVEDAGVKCEVFNQLARVTGEGTILASNTSSISITEIGAAADAAHAGAARRTIGMHFFYPVPVMQLVEVINGLATAPEVTGRVIELAGSMGKTAVPANDQAGFVSNRVLMPMINEAFYAWMEGVAEPEHIDSIMKLGCNFPMGPLRLADFIGLDTCAHIMDVLAEGLNSERYRPCPKLRQLVTAGRLGNKTRWGVFDYREG
ncbi:MAG: 3-hydroxyacyl-CoA dehydrogenase NAD-binding domain-containing protein [Planctomycetota bacterium]